MFHFVLSSPCGSWAVRRSSSLAEIIPCLEDLNCARKDSQLTTNFKKSVSRLEVGLLDLLTFHMDPQNVFFYDNFFPLKNLPEIYLNLV